MKKYGGVAALLCASLYLLTFIYFGVLFAPPQGDTVLQLGYLAEHQFSFSLIYVLGYQLFGLALAVLVVVLQQTLKKAQPALGSLASLFGSVWAGLVLASGMIANIGLAQVLRLLPAHPEQAASAWTAISSLVEALGGGNEIVGGCWTLVIGLALLRRPDYSRALAYAGIAVGIVGIATAMPAGWLTPVFGLSQLLWFAGLGLQLLRKR